MIVPSACGRPGLANCCGTIADNKEPSAVQFSYDEHLLALAYEIVAYEKGGPTRFCRWAACVLDDVFA